MTPTQTSDTSSKDRDLVEAIIDNVVPRCGCDFTEDRITERVFQCFPSSPHTVTYHAQLHGTLQAPVPQLLTALQEWASSVNTIAVQFLPLSVESFCAVPSSSPLEQCPGDTNTMPSTMATAFTTPEGTDDLPTSTSDATTQQSSDTTNPIDDTTNTLKNTDTTNIPNTTNSQSSVATAIIISVSVVVLVIITTMTFLVTLTVVVIVHGRHSSLEPNNGNKTEK